jgi:AcrR family transcriptional regulator
VCREALALVDEEGLDALSMRRLGARLGVEAMSLYRHVRDKDDLLDALHAAVLGDLEPHGKGDSWRAVLGGLARALRAVLLRHPNVTALFVTRPLASPVAMVPVERARAALERDGFAPKTIGPAIIAVGVYTLGHVMGEANARPSPNPMLPPPPGAAEFEFGLEAMLDGLAKHARRRR